MMFVGVAAYLGLTDAHFRLGKYEDSLVCIDCLLELDDENTQIKPILTDYFEEYIKVPAEEERYDEDWNYTSESKGYIDWDNNMAFPFEYDDISSPDEGTSYGIKVHHMG